MISWTRVPQFNAVLRRSISSSKKRNRYRGCEKEKNISSI